MLTSPPTIAARRRDLQAVALVLLSAALFGSLAVLAQLAYGTGVSVLGLLVGRFTVAGAVLWLIVLVLRRPLAVPSRVAHCRGPWRWLQFDGALFRGLAEAHRG